MQHEFTTKVNLEYHYNLNKYLNIPDDIDIEVSKTELYVNWTVEFEMREWGIKSVIASVINVYGELELEVNGEFLLPSEKEALTNAGFAEMSSGEFYFRQIIHTRNSPMEITDEIKFDSDQLMPSEIEIDFLTKKINVK